MKYNKEYLYNAFNATSTDDGNGDIETYENWLERQLISRLVKLDGLKDAAQSFCLDFIDWLMTNCELSEDQTIWSYNSEDYSLEGIYEVYKNHTKP